MVDGSSIIGFPLVIADSEEDMQGIEPGPLSRHTSADMRYYADAADTSV